MTDRDENRERRRFAELLQGSSLGSDEARSWIESLDPAAVEQIRDRLGGRGAGNVAPGEDPPGGDRPPSATQAMLAEHPEWADELFAGPTGDPLRFRVGRGPWASGAQGVLYRAIEVGPGQYPYALKELTTTGVALDDLVDTWRSRLAQFRTLYANPRFATPIEMFVGAPPAPPGHHAEDGRRIFVVMPWVEGDDLTAHLDEHRGPKHLVGTLQLLLTVAETLDWLQSQRANHTGDRFVHGDVKPSNIIATRGGGVLVDPDLSRREVRDVDDRWGTPRYAAPEVFERGDYTGASDRFSFGKVVCEVLLGEPPPTGADTADLRNRLRGSDALRDRPELVSEVVPMLAASPGQRPAQAAPWLQMLIEALRDRGLPDPGELSRRRRLRGRVALVTAGLLLAGSAVVVGTVLPSDACAPGSVEPVAKGDGVLKFGTLVPRSGQLTAQGPQQSAAAEMAGTDIAAAGGIPGIQVLPAGQGSELDEGQSGTKQVCESAALLLADGVDVIVGPSASANSADVIGLVTAAGGMAVSPASTSPALSGPGIGRFFRTAPSDVMQGRILGDLVVSERNTTVTVVARDDTYGRDLQGQVAEEIRGQGVATEEATYSATSPDFGPIVAGLRARPTDAVVLVGFDETAGLLRQMIEGGVGPEDRRVYGTEGFLRQTLPLQVVPGRPAILQGLRGTTLLPGDPAFVARLRAFRPGLADISFAAQTYDATVVAALAAASAGTDDPRIFAGRMSAVTTGGTPCTTFAACMTLLRADRAADIDYDGVSGPLELTGAGEPCRAIYSVVRFDARGQLVEYARGTGSNLCTGLS